MKPKLKELFLASFEFEDYNPLQTKVLILNAMLFITLIINSIFLSINIIFTHNYLLSLINAFILLLMVYTLYILRKKGEHGIAGYMGNVTLFLAFIALVVFEKGAHFTLIWSYFFAPFAIITLGARQGLMVSFTFIVSVLAIAYTGIDNWQNGSWDIESYIRFFLAHFVMLYVMYAVQNSNENAHNKIEILREKEKLQLKILEKMSITDMLTTLYNRRYFEEIFPRQIERAASRQMFFVYFILDLDRFKQYNDTYGHQKGDWVLREIGELLKTVFNKSDDYVFRIGGEEFAGIFLDYDIKNIQLRIQNITERLKEKHIEHTGSPNKKTLTCSIGVYVKSAEDPSTMQEIYRLADEALYKAKDEGRNKIIYA